MRNIFVIILALFFSSKSFAIDFELYNSALMLQVVRANNQAYICSSIAVSRTKLITAAHCLDGAVQVRVFKEYEVDNQNTFYRVRKFAKFHKYNRQRSFFLYDLGIIELAERLPDSIRIYPVLRSGERIEELQRVGYGMRNGVNAITVVSPVLQFKFEKDYIDMLDEFSYSGDSGGPVLGLSHGRFTIVGIHSTKQGYSSFNPRITSEIKAWIDRF